MLFLGGENTPSTAKLHVLGCLNWTLPFSGPPQIHTNYCILLSAASRHAGFLWTWMHRVQKNDRKPWFKTLSRNNEGVGCGGLKTDRKWPHRGSFSGLMFFTFMIWSTDSSSFSWLVSKTALRTCRRKNKQILKNLGILFYKRELENKKSTSEMMKH